MWIGFSAKLPRPLDTRSLGFIRRTETRSKYARQSRRMSDAYARALARTASAQIAEASGFQGMKESVSDALAELMVRYLKELGSSSHAYAELAGRTQATFTDVVRALEDTGLDLDLIHEYVEKEEEIPFARTVPSFPVRKRAKRLPTFAERDELPPESVSAFLPAFPDKHTYKSTPAYDEHETDPKVQKELMDRQRKDSKRSLSSLKRKTDPSVPLHLLEEERGRWGDMHVQHGSIPMRARQAAAEADAVARNPFLAPPETIAPTAQVDGERRAGSPVSAFVEGMGGRRDMEREMDRTGIVWEDAEPSTANASRDGPPLTFSFDWTSRTRATAAASCLGVTKGSITVFPSAPAATHEAEQERLRKQRRAQEIFRRGAESALLQEEEDK